MQISIITVFPSFYENFLKTSLVGRAISNNLVRFNIVQFSSFCEPKERIDEPCVGPGAGVIIKPQIVEKAITSCEKQFGKAFKIFFSPQGKVLDQNILNKIAKETTSKPSNENDEKSQKGHIILVCARYEGMDERVETSFADEIISIGDYVLMGGDLPAQVFLEGFLRLIPGIVGKAESVEKESFEGPFLDYSNFGLPETWNNQDIPAVLRSGNHGEIEKWRSENATQKTILKRFDWLRKNVKKEEDMALVSKFIPSHYVALMHSDVVVKSKGCGDTSITSIDIHDIARSAATYGIKNYFVVSRLEDQHMILETFLKFWKSPEGKSYNFSRYNAVSRVEPTKSLDEALQKIETIEGKKPILIATSAQSHSKVPMVDFYSQGKIWEQNRPVLIIFGTGQGLSEELLEKCDYMLGPVRGIPNYNHLSVRSAAAIVLDRWLGINEISQQ
ncbi:TPA: tRNA (guanosine(37)-N1)-methyltransferase TrmD [Candidatus Dependentiae bacterium]|nr:MAG: tRNA (guanine-N(1)-)-methyltransferase [candidate division TM6 bacterium GW2011_GWE2_31_21]KKP54155.1 MAG: tRNA (guanine-N(1)-)-methyltransferase [candidate division TM6 bacterium GW2011_GWF2_33_332]HBS47876.1 tRNA (guanosine(37)-N1)-methyltransferase TrmD [Candidatus Dependentiae bacterium]HBZ73061.1 tRNA (guanosine(37)-N1)-methyltransferase TrmD [Candidatus Dependentiae bacterium]